MYLANDKERDSNKIGGAIIYHSEPPKDIKGGDE